MGEVVEKRFSLSGYVSPILEFEKKEWDLALEELKDCEEEVKDMSEDYVTRFVRGSAFVKKQKERTKRIVRTVRENLKFREANGISTIFSDKLEYLKELRVSLFPGFFIGRTSKFNLETDLTKEEERRRDELGTDYSYKTNRAVLLMDLNDADFSAAKVFNNKEEMLIKHLVFAQELLRLKALNSWEVNSRVVLVIDLSRLTMKDYYAAYKAGISKVFSILGENYPESIDRVLLLQPPTVFSMCFKMLKPFIQPDTVLKIKPVKKSDIEQTLISEGIDLSIVPDKHLPSKENKNNNQEEENNSKQEVRFLGEHVIDDASAELAADDNINKDTAMFLDLIKRTYANNFK